MSERHLARVAVALDTSDRRQFGEWCRFFGPRVGVLKVGLEAFVRWGPDIVREARDHARKIFLDLKLHDIPNTVAGAIASAEALGADYVTIHAGGGRPMIEAATRVADELQVLAVTLLTHLDASALRELGHSVEPKDRVGAWARLAEDAGCHGVVCSSLEVATVRERVGRRFLVVTPGIRPAGESTDDQRRTTTPAAALGAGADLLVIGRPLTRATDPALALDELAAELSRVDRCPPDGQECAVDREV